MWGAGPFRALGAAFGMAQWISVVEQGQCRRKAGPGGGSDRGPGRSCSMDGPNGRDMSTTAAVGGGSLAWNGPVFHHRKPLWGLPRGLLNNAASPGGGLTPPPPSPGPPHLK